MPMPPIPLEQFGEDPLATNWTEFETVEPLVGAVMVIPAKAELANVAKKSATNIFIFWISSCFFELSGVKGIVRILSALLLTHK